MAGLQGSRGGTLAWNRTARKPTTSLFMRVKIGTQWIYLRTVFLSPMPCCRHKQAGWIMLSLAGYVLILPRYIFLPDSPYSMQISELIQPQPLRACILWTLKLLIVTALLFPFLFLLILTTRALTGSFWLVLLTLLQECIEQLLTLVSLREIALISI